MIAILGFSANAAPNLLIILADDMGYGDLGCTGSETIATPHIDALAASGVLCTQAYVASSVCSPSRAGLITGRDPRRFGYESNLNQGESAYPTRPELLGLPTNEYTLGDHLRAANYATGLIGKWHLGMGDGFHPNARGFDHFLGMLGGSHGYFPTATGNQLERNGAPVTEFSSPYLTDYFTDEAIDWMTAAREQPFFLFLSYNAPHTPMQATEEDLARYEHIENPKRRTYAAMMHALDRGVGRITAALNESGERENTLIVFFSDNGGATSNASWNGPLSGAKGTLLEGGVRVPMIWSWPGTIAEGATSASPVSSLDLLPTFLAAAEAEGLPLQETQSYQDPGNQKRAVKRYGAYDGIDLLPGLKSPDALASRTLFWRLQGQKAVLHGGEKLIVPSHRPPQLFRPAEDLGERVDLASDEPSQVQDLFTRLAEWESMLTTRPLWYSSPRWSAESTKHYEQQAPRAEPGAGSE